MKIKIICCKNYSDVKCKVDYTMHGHPETIQKLLVELVKIAKKYDSNITIADYTSSTAMIMGHIIRRGIVSSNDVECEVHDSEFIRESGYREDGVLTNFPYGYYISNLDSLVSDFNE